MTHRNECTTHEHESPDEFLIEKMIEGELSPSELAQHCGISLNELAQWAAETQHIKALEHLARLADLRAQMLVARYRATAAVRLIAIASADEPSELSRKACVDLLKTDLDVFDHMHDDDCAAQTPEPPSEQAILDALERLGAESE